MVFLVSELETKVKLRLLRHHHVAMSVGLPLLRL